MEKISSLLVALKNSANDYPHLKRLTFVKGGTFGWNHTACAITYAIDSAKSEPYLLHEFGHALLNHSDYSDDISLLKMERAAWDEAVSIAQRLAIELPADTVEDALDTYRDWLHSRSLCPHCGATGFQSSKRVYSCIACGAEWRVNEARACALRRSIIKKRP